MNTGDTLSFSWEKSKSSSVFWYGKAAALSRLRFWFSCRALASAKSKSSSRSLKSASALAVAAAFLIYERVNGKRNVYKAIANDIFRDYNSKAIIVDDFWTHQYTEKMISVAKGIASEQEKRILIEECVNRILNVRFQAENLCATTMALRNFQMGMLFFCWALQAMDVDSGFLFDIIMQWVERSRTGFMAVLDMPYDTKDYKAWRDKINAVAGVMSNHPSLILSVRENLFNRYLPNVKGEDRLRK